MAEFRTCPQTGLKIERTAENLIKANIGIAVLLLAVGGLLGLFIALTRWPAVHLLPAGFYYRFLTLHGIVALLAWILFFEMALIYFTSAVMLNARAACPRLSWLSFLLMLVGGVTITLIVLMGGADVMFTSYVPLQASPIYYLGVILFAVGALIGFILFFVNVLNAKKEGAYQRSLPLGTYGVFAASIIGVSTLLHGAVIMIPTLLWSLGLLPNIDPSLYRLIFWGLGHSSQQINVCAMIACWYMAAYFTVGAMPVNERVSRTGFLLYILFINVASEHHLLVDPALSTLHKIVNTGYIMHLAVLASMIHAFCVPASVEVALRKKGYTAGLFEWLKKAPWGNPGFSATLISMLLFGFLGGITGVIFGTEQFNMIRHNTLAITGHFHGTVVGGTSIAFMGFSYIIFPLIFRRELILQGLAKLQPYIYGLGVTMLSIGMMAAGSFGVPRRHADITFAGASFPYSFDPTADIFLTMAGLGGVLAAVGGVSYVLIILGSIFAGKKTS